MIWTNRKPTHESRLQYKVSHYLPTFVYNLKGSFGIANLGSLEVRVSGVVPDRQNDGNRPRVLEHRRPNTYKCQNRTRELLNFRVIRHLVGIWTKIIPVNGMSGVLFRVAPPIGGGGASCCVVYYIPWSIDGTPLHANRSVMLCYGC